MFFLLEQQQQENDRQWDRWKRIMYNLQRSGDLEKIVHESNMPSKNILLQLSHHQGTNYAIQMEKILDENPVFKKKYHVYLDDNSDVNGVASSFVNTKYQIGFTSNATMRMQYIMMMILDLAGS